MILTRLVQVIDSQIRPVEAPLQFGQRLRMNNLVDLDREKQKIQFEALKQDVDDLDRKSVV